MRSPGVRWSACLLALGGLNGCGAGGPGPNGEPANVPGWPDYWLDAGDGQDHGLLERLELDLEGPLALEVGERATVKGQGVFADGTRVELPDRVVWTLAPDAVATLEAQSGQVELEGLEPGTGTLELRAGAITAGREVSVLAAEVVRIRIEPLEPTEVGGAGALRAIGIGPTGRERDITGEVTWGSDAPEVALVLDDPTRKGRTWGSARGKVQVRAVLGDVSGALEIEVPCHLGDGRFFREGEVVPPFQWESVAFHTAEGESLRVPLSMEALMCDARFDRYRGFVLSLNAGWCGPCTGWIREVARKADQMEAEGLLPLLVLGETATVDDTEGATTEYAERHVSQAASPSSFPSVRIGNAEASRPGGAPASLLQVFGDSEKATGWPTIMLLRRWDMKMIGFGYRDDVPGWLDARFAEYASDIPASPPVKAACEVGAEEWSEPNESAALAAPLGLDGAEGTICRRGVDFLRNISGETLQLELRSDVDLDLYAWNPETDAPLIGEDGRPVISSRIGAQVEKLSIAPGGVVQVRARVAGTEGRYTLSAGR